MQIDWQSIQLNLGFSTMLVVNSNGRNALSWYITIVAWLTDISHYIISENADNRAGWFLSLRSELLCDHNIRYCLAIFWFLVYRRTIRNVLAFSHHDFFDQFGVDFALMKTRRNMPTILIFKWKSYWSKTSRLALKDKILLSILSYIKFSFEIKTQKPPLNKYSI